MDEMSNTMQETGLKWYGHVNGRAEGHVRQHRWDGLDRKHERQDWGGMEKYGGKMMGILREG